MSNDSSALQASRGGAALGEPRSIWVDAPRIGRCEGSLQIEPGKEPLLLVAATDKLPQGQHVPIRLRSVNGAESVSTVGRVTRDSSDRVELALPADDERLNAALASWFTEPRIDTTSADAQSDGEEDLTYLLESDDDRDPPSPLDPTRDRYQALLGEADRLQFDSRSQEAFARIEEALSIYPVDAEELHVRLAKLAMDAERLSVAEKHADAAHRLNPSRRDAAHLLRTIQAQRTTRRLTAPPISRRSATPKRQLAAFGIAAAIVVISIGWNIYRYAIPRGDKPESLALTSFDDIFPADRVLVQNKVVYVMVDERWAGLGKSEKETKTRALAERSKRLSDVERLVVTTEEPRVVATWSQGSVRVYR